MPPAVLSPKGLRILRRKSLRADFNLASLRPSWLDLRGDVWLEERPEPAWMTLYCNQTPVAQLQGVGLDLLSMNHLIFRLRTRPPRRRRARR